MTNRTENGSLLFFSAGQEDCQSLLCRQDTVTIVHVQQDIWPGRGGSASPANAPGLATRVSSDTRVIDKQAIWEKRLDWRDTALLADIPTDWTACALLCDLAGQLTDCRNDSVWYLTRSHGDTKTQGRCSEQALSRERTTLCRHLSRQFLRTIVRDDFLAL